MIQDERRAYVRARLVALAEEVMMVSAPKPTEAQLRQHALDRAVTDGMTALVQSSLFMSAPPGVSSMPSLEDTAKAVTRVADVFVEYLREDDISKEEHEANLGAATVRELLVELAVRIRDEGGDDAHFRQINQVRHEMSEELLDTKGTV